MLLTNGVDDALRLLMETFVEPGDSVLVPEPTFSMYRFFSEVAGANVEVVRYDEAMRFPLEETLKALRRAPRILFLANPNNPTGTLLDQKALARILDAAPRTLVLVDEAYFEFAGVDGAAVDPAARQIWLWRALFPRPRPGRAAAGRALRARTTGRCDAAGVHAVSGEFAGAGGCGGGDGGPADFCGDYVQRGAREPLAARARAGAAGRARFSERGKFLLVDFGAGRGTIGATAGARGILVRDRASDFGRDGFVRITAGTPAQTQTVLRAIEREWA